jgi:hypothetical protein
MSHWTPLLALFVLTGAGDPSTSPENATPPAPPPAAAAPPWTPNSLAGSSSVTSTAGARAPSEPFPTSGPGAATTPFPLSAPINTSPSPPPGLLVQP